MTEKKKPKNKFILSSKSPYVGRGKEKMELTVGEIHSGALAIKSAYKKFGLNRNTLKLWMTRLSVGSLMDKTNKTISSTIEDDKNAQEYKQQVCQLEKALEYARLKILGLETMIKVTEEDL